MAAKECSKCGLLKPLEQFYPHNEGKFGRRPDCIACHGERTKAYRAANVEKLRAWHKKHRAENREVLKAKDKAYYKKNKAILIQKMVEYNRKNKEAYLERMRRWRKNNPEKVQVWVRNRRLKVKNVWHKIADIERMLTAQSGKCIYCRVDITERKSREVDHIIPVSRGGTGDPRNLQLLCVSCNRKKRAQLPEEFLKQQEPRNTNGRHLEHAESVECNSRK